MVGGPGPHPDRFAVPEGEIEALGPNRAAGADRPRSPRRRAPGREEHLGRLTNARPPFHPRRSLQEIPERLGEIAVSGDHEPPNELLGDVVSDGHGARRYRWAVTAAWMGGRTEVQDTY